MPDQKPPSDRETKQPFASDIEGMQPGDYDPNLETLQSLLKHFGYFLEPYTSGFLDEPTETALRRYQEFHQLLPATGRPDTATLIEIQKPRCWNADLSGHLDKGKILTDPLADYNDDLRIGCDYCGAKELTYTIVTFPTRRGIPNERRLLVAEITSAFTTWQNFLPIPFRFIPDDPAGNADFQIGWYENGHNDDQPFTSTPNHLAHAYYPGKCGGSFSGFCHFDKAARWAFDENIGSSNFDIQTMAVHEIGHLLGLTHSKDRNSIMFDEYIFTGDRRRRNLSDDVKEAIQSIYNHCP